MSDEINNNKGIETWIDPSIEARIVALVLGESSDFERDDLENIMRDRPELRAFYHRIQATHRLLAESEMPAAAAHQGWRMEAGRRNALLEKIRSEKVSAPEALAKVVAREKKSKRSQMLRIMIPFAIAAVLAALMLPIKLATIDAHMMETPELSIAPQSKRDEFLYDNDRIAEADAPWSEVPSKPESDLSELSLSNRTVDRVDSRELGESPEYNSPEVSRGFGFEKDTGNDVIDEKKKSVAENGKDTWYSRSRGLAEQKLSVPEPQETLAKAEELDVESLRDLRSQTRATMLNKVDQAWETGAVVVPAQTFTSSLSRGEQDKEGKSDSKEGGEVDDLQTLPAVGRMFGSGGVGGGGGEAVPSSGLRSGGTAIASDAIDGLLNEIPAARGTITDYAAVPRDASVEGEVSGGDKGQVEIEEFGLRQMTVDDVGLKLSSSLEAIAERPAAPASEITGLGGVIMDAQIRKIIDTVTDGREKKLAEPEQEWKSQPGNIATFKKAESGARESREEEAKTGQGLQHWSMQRPDVQAEGKPASGEPSVVLNEEADSKGISRWDLAREPQSLAKGAKVQDADDDGFNAVRNGRFGNVSEPEVVPSDETLGLKAGVGYDSYYAYRGADIGDQSAWEDGIVKEEDEKLAQGVDGKTLTFFGKVPTDENGELHESLSALREGFSMIGEVNESELLAAQVELGFEERIKALNQTVAVAKPMPVEKAEKIIASPETLTSDEPFSTFSLHVSDVSFKLAQAALLENSEWPEAEKIRVEEFVNAFDYGDPPAALSEKVACQMEQAAHPFLAERNLMRVSMRTAAMGRDAAQPLRLTVLLDLSGSMERADREASVAKAIEALAGHLTASDTVTLIGFAREPHLLADRYTGDRAGELVGLVKAAPSEGGTNLEEALRLADEVAKRQFDESGQNRIVLLTDGAANLGDAEPESLSKRIVALRQAGIAFDACGVGADGLNDAVLEALTRDGDGRYYFLNRPEDADEGFIKQLAGALRPSAKNVKVQVKFNPDRVPSYRLLGFEKHLLKKEDFRNDSVDAAEMASAEAGVAVHQFQVNPSGSGDVGEVFVRFQDMATGEMVERSWPIPFEKRAAPFDEAAPSLQLAGCAAFLGEKLRGGPEAGNIELGELMPTARAVRTHCAASPRVNQLIDMMEKARSLESAE